MGRVVLQKPQLAPAATHIRAKPPSAAHKKSTSRSKDRQRKHRTRSRSPERYSETERYPPKRDDRRSVPKQTMVNLNKSDDFASLGKVLTNMNLQCYEKAFQKQRYGLSDVMRAIVQKDMKVIEATVSDIRHRIRLVTHVQQLMHN